MEISCHCKNIKITMAKPKQITQCNCSICSRYMSLWGYYQPNEVKIEIGSCGASSYSWGDKELNFIHCSNCGCVTHYETKPNQPDPRVAINFSMDKQQVAEVFIRYFNGAEM